VHNFRLGAKERSWSVSAMFHLKQAVQREIRVPAWVCYRTEEDHENP
jgi:ribosomal protein L39E